MFFCEECGERNRWPMFVARSFGKCEVCGKVCRCHDRPSWMLPERKPKMDPVTGIMVAEPCGRMEREEGK